MPKYVSALVHKCNVEVNHWVQRHNWYSGVMVTVPASCTGVLEFKSHPGVKFLLVSNLCTQGLKCIVVEDLLPSDSLLHVCCSHERVY